MSIDVNGQSYLLSPLKEKHLGEMNLHLRQLYLDAAKSSVPEKPTRLDKPEDFRDKQEFRREYMETMFRTIGSISIESAEGQDFLGTMSGMAKALQISLREHQNNMSLDDATDLLLEMRKEEGKLEEFGNKFAILCGLDFEVEEQNKNKQEEESNTPENPTLPLNKAE